MSLMTVEQLHAVTTDMIEHGCGDYVVFAVCDPDDVGEHIQKYRINMEGAESGTLDLIFVEGDLEDDEL